MPTSYNLKVVRQVQVEHVGGDMNGFPKESRQLEVIPPTFHVLNLGIISMDSE